MKVTKDIFVPKSKFDLTYTNKYNHQILEKNIFKHFKEDVKMKYLNYGCNMLVVSSEESTVKYLLYIFCNYDMSNSKNYLVGTNNVYVWQAIRATSTAPTYFDTIEINSHKYVDGGCVANNQTKIAIEQAKIIYTDKNIYCIVSLVTGFACTNLSNNKLFGIVKKIAIRATDSEFTHNEVRKLYTNNYFRFTPSIPEIKMDEKRKEYISNMKSIAKHDIKHDIKNDSKQKLINLIKIISDYKNFTTDYNKDEFEKNGKKSKEDLHKIIYIRHVDDESISLESHLTNLNRLADNSENIFVPTISVIGDTTVGKSFLLNHLIGNNDNNENKLIVLDIRKSTKSTTEYINCILQKYIINNEKVKLIDYERTKGTFTVMTIIKTIADNLHLNKYFPKLSYLLSDVVILIGIEDFANSEYKDKCLKFVKEATDKNINYTKPALIIVQNKININNIPDLEEYLDVEFTTYQNLNGYGSDFDFDIDKKQNNIFEIYFSYFKCIRLPDVKTLTTKSGRELIKAMKERNFDDIIYGEEVYENQIKKTKSIKKN